MPAADDSKRKAARETIDILHEISTLLVRSTINPVEETGKADCTQNTHLDRQSLSYCVSLIENGVNPEALAVREPIYVLRNLMSLTRRAEFDQGLACSE